MAYTYNLFICYLKAFEYSDLKWIDVYYFTIKHQTNNEGNI